MTNARQLFVFVVDKHLCKSAKGNRNSGGGTKVSALRSRQQWSKGNLGNFTWRKYIKIVNFKITVFESWMVLVAVFIVR